METPNNHKAIQVENLKTALDEWKHVVVKVDSIINTEDPIKRAASQILASSCLYAIFYLLSVSFFSPQRSLYHYLTLFQPSTLTAVSVLLMLGLIADKLINVINERLLASSEFNNEKEKRFHSICSFLVGLWQNILIRIDQALAIKAKSPFKFLFGSVPILSITAFLGTKIYLTTMLWLYVTFKSIKKIPQVKEQVSLVQILRVKKNRNHY